MHTLKSVMLFITVLWLPACTGNRPEDSFNDEFVTEITGDGTKFFTYIRLLPAGTGEHQGNGPDNSLKKAVQAKLDTSGYCRDSYLVLERYQANGIARIRGECRDGASDTDRVQFPNHP